MRLEPSSKSYSMYPLRHLYCIHQHAVLLINYFNWWQENLIEQYITQLTCLQDNTVAVNIMTIDSIVMGFFCLNNNRSLVTCGYSFQVSEQFKLFRITFVQNNNKLHWYNKVTKFVSIQYNIIDFTKGLERASRSNKLFRSIYNLSLNHTQKSSIHTHMKSGNPCLLNGKWHSG